MPNRSPQDRPTTKAAPLTSSPTPVPEPTPTESYISSRHHLAIEHTLSLSQWLNSEASGDRSGIFDTPPQTGQFAPLAQAILDCGRNMPSHIQEIFEIVIQAREEVLAHLRREATRADEERRERGELIREREEVLEK